MAETGIDASALTAAQIAEENPNPTFRVALGGQLLYTNSACGGVLSAWSCRQDGIVPEHVRRHIAASLESRDRVEWSENFNSRWLLFEVVPFADKGYASIFGRDIEKRRQVESQLRILTEQLRSFFELSPDLMAIADYEGRFRQLSPSWQRTLGHSIEELTRHPWLHFVHPDDHEKTIAAGAKVMRGEPLSLFENRYRARDGSYRWIEWHSIGAPQQRLIFCIARDITERKAGEDAARQANVSERNEAARRRNFTSNLLGLFAQKSSAKEYLASVVDILREWSDCEALGIRILNAERQIPYEAAAGFESGFLELEHCLSLKHDNCCCTRVVSERFEEQDKPLLTPGGSYRCEDTVSFLKELPVDKQARYRGNCQKFGFASVVVTPIRYRGEIIGAIHLADRRAGRFEPAKMEFVESVSPLIGEAIHRFQAEAELARYRDQLETLVQQRTRELESANSRLHIEIAERQRAQETLQQTAEELRRSNQDLEQFAYVASHDLQEPLRAVGGYVKLLQRRFPEQLDPKAVEYIEGASDGATRMERLITDLLDFARVGTHGGAFQLARLDALLDDALRNLEASIKSAGARVTREPLPSLPVDATQFMQLFQNLIANAIKFRSERPLEINVAAERQKDRWVFSVKDNGIGIHPQYFERIFQIFQRLHTRKRYPGTGIGLAICKRIVERHGGMIWVDSEPGRGATFRFSVPLSSFIRKAAL